MDTTNKKTLTEEIALATEGLDTTPNPEVTIAIGGSLGTKSCSDYGQTDLAEKVLKDRIRLCIEALETLGKNVSITNIDNLLGFNKNTEYTLENGNKRFVKELFSDINNYIEVPVEREDPTNPEHMHYTITTGIIGSSLPLTKNQLIYAQHLKPIFDDRLNHLIVVQNNSITSQSTNTVSSKDLMSGLLWMILSSRGWFHHSMSMNSTYTYCEHLNNLIKITLNSGRVHSKNKSFDYIFRVDKTYKYSKLIERYGSYLTGIRSYKYRLTKTLEEVLQEVIKLFKQLNLAPSTENILDSDIIIEKDMLDKLNTRDLYLLFNHLDGYNKGIGYIIKNSTEIDRQESRVYSLFTSIKGDTRKALGFTSYDISACMQTIVGAYVDMEKYPRHKELLDDKHNFREQLSNELDVDTDTVKTIISAADNGHQHKKIVGKSELLREYIDESSTLIDEYTSIISSIKPNMVETASLYANDIKKFTGMDKNSKKKYINLGVNPYSLFFFIWTQTEREIRHAMASCFQGFVHEVHDAIYSKEVLDTTVLEKAVLAQTGITVKIEH